MRIQITKLASIWFMCIIFATPTPAQDASGGISSLIGAKGVSKGMECRGHARGSSESVRELAVECNSVCTPLDREVRRIPPGGTLPQQKIDQCGAVYDRFRAALERQTKERKQQAEAIGDTIPDVDGGLKSFKTATGVALVIAAERYEDWGKFCGSGAIVKVHSNFTDVRDRRARLRVRLTGIRLPPIDDIGRREGRCTADSLERIPAN